MDISEFDLINEVFVADSVSPIQMDHLLAEGWRHFGQQFFRYNVGFLKNELRFVKPLRIKLSEFSFSRSQKRVRRRNQDLKKIIRPVEFDRGKHELFERHSQRFTHGRPKNIFSFLDEQAATVPCGTLEFCFLKGERLVAVSYLDIGHQSVSSVYAMFEPEFSKRSLGIYTMLSEIEYAIETGKSLYYQGYAYEGESFYDYKKGFAATECFDWKGNWIELN
ncbi:MAG: GNAT family N-acetyltransferase [Acidobacteriota bacterium]|nr:GNAT family N-acetyltransferase [Acidobacteriota bacterium]